MLLKSGNSSRALAEFQKAVELNPVFLSAREQMAALFAAANQWQAAAVQLQAILRLRPGQLETRYRLVEAFQQLRDHKGVAHELALCLLVDPRNASSHYNLGVALLMEGSDRQQANSEFRRALDLKPDYEDARKALDAMRK